MLERFPSLSQQREAALAQAAHRAQKGVPGPGINVQLFDYGAPAINPKRPYRDSYIERSIAEILDALTATGNGTRRGITSISPPRPGSTSPVCTWRR
jgi:hypothetical protein